MTTSRSVDVTHFPLFGTAKQEPHPFKCRGFLLEPFVVPSCVIEHTARALANCKVASVYLDSPTALQDPKHSRWEDARRGLLDLCQVTTSDLLKTPTIIAAINKPGVSLADMRFSLNASKENKHIGKVAASDERFSKIAKGRTLAVKYDEKAGLLAMAIEEETDDVGDSSDKGEQMAMELLELEDGPGGVGRLFGSWRDIQMA